MYTRPNEVLNHENMWFDLIVGDGLEKKAALALLCSLMNCALSQYDPTGWVPYNHLVIGDHKEQLASLSMQCLVAMMDGRSSER